MSYLKCRKVSLVLLLSCTLLAACGVEKSALSALNLADSNDHYEKTADIAYGPDARQRMDYYQPVSSTTAIEKSGITVVFIHGGAWRTGSKDEYEFIGSSLTKLGHNVLIPSYRLYPQVTFPDFVDDIAISIATLENYLQPENTTTKSVSPLTQLVLMGHSSGAHQAALLLTDQSYFDVAEIMASISGLVAIAGPYDLPLDLPEVALAFPNVTDQLKANPVMQANTLSESALAKNKVLLLHGVEDERVLAFHTDRLAESLRHAGAVVKVEKLNGGHAGAVLAMAMPLSFLNDSLNYVESFLGTISAVDPE